jgi:hypothetical protein
MVQGIYASDVYNPQCARRPDRASSRRSHVVPCAASLRLSATTANYKRLRPDKSTISIASIRCAVAHVDWYVLWRRVSSLENTATAFSAKLPQQ